MTQELISKYELESEPTTIYTDGSRSEYNISTGSSYYIPEEEMGYMISIDKKCSNFTEEAVAILKAMQLMINKENGKDIIIYSDALSVIQAVTNNNLSVYINVYILEIRKKYFELKNKEYRVGKKIVLCWVPAHIGVEGNEIADQLVKKATTEEHTQDMEVPLENLKRNYKEEMRKKSILEIKQQGNTKGKEYFNNYFKEDEAKPWFKVPMRNENL